MKLYYKDFVTGKRRFTQGEPTKAMRGGILQAWGLAVQCKSSTMFIPEYLLEVDGRKILESLKPQQKEELCLNG